MKKALYLILLLAELLVGFLLMSVAWVNIGWLPCVITIALWAALLIRQVVLLKKDTDAAKVRQIKGNIVLIMLIPSAIYIVMVLWLIITLFGVI